MKNVLIEILSRKKCQIHGILKCCIWLFFFVLVCGPTISVYASMQIRLNSNKYSYSTLFEELEKQTGYRFFYKKGLFDNNAEIEVAQQQANLDDVLANVLTSKGYNYYIKEGVVVINKASGAIPKASAEEEKKIITLKGTVVDSKGESLPGVSVQIAGTSIGCATDINGVFKLEVPVTGTMKLSFSFIGMVTEVVPVSQSNENMRVVLKDDSKTLDEVVVRTGYFERKKDSYTGAATTFSGEKLREVSTQNVMTTLSMIDPSFKLVDNIDMGSNPNNIPEFTIRGGGSLESEYGNSPNMPIFILDGFQVSAQKIFDLDPNRVSSVTLLKDASATAIYGSRAANGVVVIETSSPDMGDLRINYNFSGDFSFADLTDYNLMNAAEKLEYERLYGMFSHFNMEYQDELLELYNKRLKKVQEGVDTDWISKPVKDMGFTQKHFLMIEGGDSKIRYAMNVNYNQNSGVIKESGRDNIGIGMKLQYRREKIKFFNDLTYSNVKEKNSPYGSFATYAQQNPYYHPYDENGNVSKFLNKTKDAVSAVTVNPLYNSTLGTTDNASIVEFNNNFSVEWDIVESLKLKGQLSLNKSRRTQDVFKPSSHTDFVNEEVKGSYLKSEQDQFTYDVNVVATFNKLFGKHFVSLNGVWNTREQQTDFYSTLAVNFPNDNMDHIGMGTSYKDSDKPQGDYNVSRLMGFAANANYGYDNRYMADFSVRSDGSSMFGANQRWGTFGSVGLAWNIHNEAFFKNHPVINELKLRGSLGTTGGQNFYPFQAITMFSYKDGALGSLAGYNDKLGALLKAYGNSDLKWQKTIKRNIGLDFALFNKRVSGYVNIYEDTSESVLVDVLLAPSTGFDSYKDNLGKVENKGVEANLRLGIIRMQSKGIQWDVFGNIMINRNKLLELNEALVAFNKVQDDKQNDAEVDAEKKVKTPVRYEEGKSINTIWVNESNGIDPNTGQEIFIGRDGNRTDAWSTGNYIPYKCGDAKYEGNFGTMFTLQGFQLNAYFRYSVGAYIYNTTLVTKVENVNPYQNADKRVLYDRWKQPGDNAKFKAITDGTQTRHTSRFVEEENYLQLSSLSLSYRFDSQLIKRWGMEQLKLTATGNDIFRASTVKMERGTTYPFARTYSLSAQVTF
ncbi:MAG: SusC/RagA family TonB-linked outer membrane protein [Marinifilaceae bacterium]